MLKNKKEIKEVDQDDVLLDNGIWFSEKETETVKEHVIYDENVLIN